MPLGKSAELLDSGLEFIRRSCDDYDNQALPQQKRLKHSTIGLATGIELLLKARLCEEHWTLILSNPDRYREGDWETGRFVSVGMEEAFARLQSIVKAGLTAETLSAIRELVAHRNQYVHFVSRASLERVTAVQVGAWHHVLELLDKGYVALTPEQEEEVDYARGKMLAHDEFLDARLGAVAEELSAAEEVGHPVIECPFCRRIALRIGDDVKCLVCGVDIMDASTYAEQYVSTLPENADPKEYLATEHVAYCSACGEKACVPVPKSLESGAEDAVIERLRLVREPGMDLEPLICFNCGAYSDRAYVRACGTCGALFLNESGREVCPNCFSG